MLPLFGTVPLHFLTGFDISFHPDSDLIAPGNLSGEIFLFKFSNEETDSDVLRDLARVGAETGA